MRWDWFLKVRKAIPTDSHFRQRCETHRKRIRSRAGTRERQNPTEPVHLQETISHIMSVACECFSEAVRGS